MKRPALVVLDVDGTILTRDHRVLPEVRAAIQGARQDGITVALATARSLAAMTHVLGDIGGVDAAICFGGAVILHPIDAPPQATATLRADQSARIVATARDLDVSLALYSLHEVFVDQLDARLRHEFEVTGLRGTEADLATVESPIIKALAISDRSDPSGLQALKDRFGAEMSVVFSHVNFLEIMHPEVSKGRAVAALRDGLGVAGGDVVAIGDSENDLSMFAVAGTAIAMGNASAAVQAEADWVTASSEEAGVARAIARCRAELWR